MDCGIYKALNLGVIYKIKKILIYFYYKLIAKSGITNWSLCYKEKKISALVRARNEEQFLYASVRSIIDYVDEVVLIDNLSNDSTPTIIRKLCEEFPNKINAYEYKHKIARCGEENERLARINPYSKNLQANHCNWCLGKCSMPYILKWDADMIATDTFYENLKLFKESNKKLQYFDGYQIEKDMKHYWISPVTNELRVFPKRHTRFLSNKITAFIYTPFRASGYHGYYQSFVGPKCYIHMKELKVSPFSNRCDKLSQEINDREKTYPRYQLTIDIKRALEWLKTNVRKDIKS